MVQQVWNWNNFRGWLSDNPFLLQEGQFQDGVSTDVQSEPNGFKITSDFSTVLAVASNPNVILDLQDFGWNWIYTFCASWEIYKDVSTTPIYTNLTGSEIVSATALWNSGTLYIYYLTAIGWLHRINVDGTGHALKESLTGYTDYAMVQYAGDLYFGDKNLFRRYTNTEVLSTIYTLPTAERITGITFFQDSFKIYSKTIASDASLTPRDGKQYVIRAGETEPDYETLWKRLPIMGVSNAWAIDYVVTGSGNNYSDLFAVSGTQRQLLKSNPDGMSLWRKFNGKIVSWKDDAFLLGWHNLAATSVNWNAIFRLGKAFPWLPQALTDIFRAGSWWTIYSILASYYQIHFGYYNTWTGVRWRAVLSIDNPVTTYNGNAYIVSQVFTGWDATIKKSLDQIDISYMCDNNNPYYPHGWDILIYARLNPSDTWTQIGTTYTKTDIGSIKITSNEITAAGLDSFFQIELKCTIVQGSSTLSPLVTGIKTTYSLLNS